MRTTTADHLIDCVETVETVFDLGPGIQSEQSEQKSI